MFEGDSAEYHLLFIWTFSILSFLYGHIIKFFQFDFVYLEQYIIMKSESVKYQSVTSKTSTKKSCG